MLMDVCSISEACAIEACKNQIASALDVMALERPLPRFLTLRT
jgi:hypothetical protein